MMTLKGSIRRAAMVVLAAGVLAIGALACGFQNNDEAVAELDTKLNRVDKQALENAVQIGLHEAHHNDQLEEQNKRLSDRITSLEDENKQQAGRIAQLEQDKQVLMDLVNTVAAGGAVAAGMAPDVMDDATALARFIECTVKAANPGANDTVLAMAAGFAETSLIQQLEAGTMTYDDIRQQIPIICAGQ